MPETVKDQVLNITEKDSKEIQEADIKGAVESNRIKFQESFVAAIKKGFNKFLKEIRRATNFEEVYAKSDILKSEVNHLEEDKKELQDYIAKDPESISVDYDKKRIQYIDEKMEKLERKYEKLDKRGDNLHLIHQGVEATKNFVINTPISLYQASKNKVKSFGSKVATIVKDGKYGFKRARDLAEKQRIAKQAVTEDTNLVTDIKLPNINKPVQETIATNNEVKFADFDIPTETNESSYTISDQIKKHGSFTGFIDSLMSDEDIKEEVKPNASIPENKPTTGERVVIIEYPNSMEEIEKQNSITKVASAIDQIGEQKEMGNLPELKEIEEVKEEMGNLPELKEIEEVKYLEPIVIASVPKTEEEKLEEQREYMRFLHGDTYDEDSKNNDDLLAQYVAELDEFENRSKSK